MHLRNPLRLGLTAAFAVTLSAQTLVVPAAANGADLASASGWPFDYAGSMRILYVYDAAHFTGQGVTTPILISRVKVRANTAAATWIGDTITNCSLDVSTAAVDYNAISTTYDTNHGVDRAQVFSGSIPIAAGSSVAGVPGPWVVDVAFSAPFLYDPTAGDLVVDWISSGPSNAANTPGLDTSSTTGQALAKRVYTIGYTGGATGSLWSGESQWGTYGTGCYDRASTVHESFTGATFDLAGSPTHSMLVVQNGSGGFTAIPGANAFFTPTSADLLLADNSLSPSLALPFAFPFGSLTTSAVKVCSNGYLWLRDTETVADLTPTVAELVGQGPRIAPYWSDLNPASLVGGARVGSIHFDVDPASGNPVFTWLGVPEAGAANVNNRCTFQIELQSSGAFELRWQTTAATAARAILTGFGFGLGARDGGSVDLSALPVATTADASRLALGLSARPTLGATFDFVTSNLPAGAVLGANLLGLVRVDPGVDLGALGAAGCRQYLLPDATAIFLVGGATNAASVAFPANPVFAGVQLAVQSAVLHAPANALGLLTSNGAWLTLDVN
jgi:hypothetical protein